MERNCKTCWHSYEGMHEMVSVRYCGLNRVVVNDAGTCEAWERKGAVIWLTGIPASDKTTIGTGMENLLHERGLPVQNLDADDVRANLSPGLSYTSQSRDKNTKRLAWLAQRISAQGTHVIVAAVSNLRIFRDRARKMVEESGGQFIEVYVLTSLGVCQERDPKGLYEKARLGIVNDIAGLHMPYEVPEKPEFVVDTGSVTPEEAAAAIIDLME